MKRYKGRIVDIFKGGGTTSVCVTGIKEKDQYKYRDNPGGFGTYVTGFDNQPPAFYFKVFVYDLNKSISIDLYRKVLDKNYKERMSPVLEECITCKNKGRKVDVFEDNGRWYIDEDQLDLIRTNGDAKRMREQKKAGKPIQDLYNNNNKYKQ